MREITIRTNGKGGYASISAMQGVATRKFCRTINCSKAEILGYMGYDKPRDQYIYKFRITA